MQKGWENQKTYNVMNLKIISHATQNMIIIFSQVKWGKLSLWLGLYFYAWDNPLNEITLNSLSISWIHYKFTFNITNSLSISWIYYEFTFNITKSIRNHYHYHELNMNSLSISRIYYDLTINITNLLWIYYELYGAFIEIPMKWM